MKTYCALVLVGVFAVISPHVEVSGSSGSLYNSSPCYINPKKDLQAIGVR